MYSVPVYILHTCDLCKALNWCLICENNYLKTLTKLIKKKETTIKDGGIHLKLLDYQRHTSNWNPLWIIDYLRIIEFLWIIKVHTSIWNDYQRLKDHQLFMDHKRQQFHLKILLDQIRPTRPTRTTRPKRPTRPTTLTSPIRTSWENPGKILKISWEY